MTSRRSEFKFVDRSYKETLLLIPGWALDCRIFNFVDLKYNYLVSTFIWPTDFMQEANSAIEELGLKRVSILGHSMGGFLAKDFALKYPEKIGELILVGIRRKYSEEEIRPVRENLRKNRAAFIYKMYDQSFSEAEKDLLSWFKSNLLKIYIQEMDDPMLDAGLDYLSKAEIRPEGLENIKTRFIHGENDAIAPIDEAAAIALRLPAARFDRVKDGGHMIPLRKDFNSIFYGDRVE